MLALLVAGDLGAVVRGRALADDEHNRRNAIAQYAKPLGNIIVAGRPDHRVRRGRRAGDLKYKRTYTDGELYAAVTGYSSQAYGATQLEGIYQDLLDGTTTG